MSNFTKEELAEAHRSLLSTLHKCEKAEISVAGAKSQATLLKRRIAALKIALSLIEKEMEQ